MALQHMKAPNGRGLPRALASIAVASQDDSLRARGFFTALGDGAEGLPRVSTDEPGLYSTRGAVLTDRPLSRSTPSSATPPAELGTLFAPAWRLLEVAP